MGRLRGVDGVAEDGGVVKHQHLLRSVFADLSTYVVTALQLAAAHHGAGFGNAVATFLALYAPTQVPLAIVEGILTVLIFRSLTTIAPKELRSLGILRRRSNTEEAPLEGARA